MHFLMFGPAEILHQLYGGLIKYTLDYFFKIYLLMQVEINWKKT